MARSAVLIAFVAVIIIAAAQLYFGGKINDIWALFTTI